jgi:hypothetical protein
VLATAAVACGGASRPGPVAAPPSVEAPRIAPGPTAVAAACAVIPVPEPAGLHPVQVVLGWRHGCALLSDTSVQCWGEGDSGQMGDGLGSSSSRPTPVAGVTRIVVDPTTRLPPLKGAAQLASGDDHVCARMQDGTVRCWGSNVHGRGGVPMPFLSWTPREVPALNGVVEIAAGGVRTCARLADGSVVCWGSGFGQGGEPPPRQRVEGLDSAVKLAIGGAVGCALDAKGGVACWGFDRDMGAFPMPGITGAVDAVAGEGDEGCAVLRDGRVRCWGSRRANFGEEADVLGIALGRRTACVLHRDGHLACDGIRVDGVRSAALGGSEGCAVMLSGDLECWPERGSQAVTRIAHQ